MEGSLGKSASPWQAARYHTALVPIANTSRQIWVTVAGQQRLEPPPSGGHRQPLVIIAAGLSGVAAEHIVVAQLVAPFARVLRFDRAGYGSSTARDESDETPLTMEQGVHDLIMVLEEIALPPPYILVGQSFGGIFSREFLRQRGNQDVVGMVLVDSIPHTPPAYKGVVDELIGVLCGDFKYEEAIGLFQNVVLTPRQVEDMRRDEKIAEENGTVAAEARSAEDSKATINDAEGMKVVVDAEGGFTDISFTKKPLGKGRLSVILGDVPRDFEVLMEFARAHGNGDEGTYRKAEEILRLSKRTTFKSQEAQAGLTGGEARVRRASGTGRTHNLHITRPDIVADEVRWVLSGVEGLANREDLLRDR